MRYLLVKEFLAYLGVHRFYSSRVQGDASKGKIPAKKIPYGKTQRWAIDIDDPSIIEYSRKIIFDNDIRFPESDSSSSWYKRQRETIIKRLESMDSKLEESTATVFMYE